MVCCPTLDHGALYRIYPIFALPPIIARFRSHFTVSHLSLSAFPSRVGLHVSDRDVLAGWEMNRGDYIREYPNLMKRDK